SRRADGGCSSHRMIEVVVPTVVDVDVDVAIDVDVRVPVDVGVVDVRRVAVDVGAAGRVVLRMVDGLAAARTGAPAGVCAATRMSHAGRRARAATAACALRVDVERRGQAQARDQGRARQGSDESNGVHFVPSCATSVPGKNRISYASFDGLNAKVSSEKLAVGFQSSVAVNSGRSAAVLSTITSLRGMSCLSSHTCQSTSPWRNTYCATGSPCRNAGQTKVALLISVFGAFSVPHQNRSASGISSPYSSCAFCTSAPMVSGAGSVA